MSDLARQAVAAAARSCAQGDGSRHCTALHRDPSDGGDNAINVAVLGRSLAGRRPVRVSFRDGLGSIGVGCRDLPRNPAEIDAD